MFLLGWLLAGNKDRLTTPDLTALSLCWLASLPALLCSGRRDFPLSLLTGRLTTPGLFRETILPTFSAVWPDYHPWLVQEDDTAPSLCWGRLYTPEFFRETRLPPLSSLGSALLPWLIQEDETAPSLCGGRLYTPDLLRTTRLPSFSTGVGFTPLTYSGRRDCPLSRLGPALHPWLVQEYDTAPYLC